MKEDVYKAIASYRASQKPPKPKRPAIIITVSVLMIVLVAVVLGSAHAIG